jgi:hypothetical protein
MPERLRRPGAGVVVAVDDLRVVLEKEKGRLRPP